ncbi:MAG: Holliday junction resolvase RuvX [Pyrinomonadaceae bacterium]
MRDFTDIQDAPKTGRILSIDLGTKKVGIAVCDEMQIAVKRVAIIKRSSSRTFLKAITTFVADFDAKAVVIGLPLNFDGTESEMSGDARKTALRFHHAFNIPVFLQDERVSTYDARGTLWKQGLDEQQMRKTLDAEAAAIILDDFLAKLQYGNSLNSK